MQEVRPPNTVRMTGNALVNPQRGFRPLLNIPGLLARFRLVVEPVIRRRHADGFKILYRDCTLLLVVPVLAAGEAWLLFGEKLSAIQVPGFALALPGVVLARRMTAQAPAKPVAQGAVVANAERA
jgi:hypothetical protein